MAFIIGYILAILVGVTLGLIGSGGSILTLPILVYIMGVDPVLATAYSLFVVGTAALMGGVQNAINKNVDFKTAVIFGAPSIAAVYLTRAFIVPHIPEEMFSIGSFALTKPIFLMLLFSVVMIIASFSMIRSKKKNEPIIDVIDSTTKEEIRSYNYPMILVEGTFVGVLTGMVGAGGGFLIIPALVIFSKMPMKLAVGTSLMIIAAKSLLGFLGDLKGDEQIDWQMLIIFTAAAVVGIFLGNALAKKIPSEKLKVYFGWFVLIMGVYIIFKEIFYLH
jgi:uncharacterized membrane protein YfcA